MGEEDVSAALCKTNENHSVLKECVESSVGCNIIINRYTHIGDCKNIGF